MEELIWTTYRNIKIALSEVERSGHDILTTTRLCLQTIVRELSVLKKQIDPGRIKEPAQQVSFYKQIFPAFLSEIIYYIKLSGIESGRPDTSDAGFRQYYKDHLTEISRYLEQQSFLRSYDQQGSDHLDLLLFTQGRTSLQVFPDTGEYKDTTFFNFSSFSLSKIKAYEQLQRFLLRNRLGDTVVTVKNAGHQRHLYTTSIPSSEFNEMDQQELANLERKISWMESKVDSNIKGMFTSPIREMQRQKKRKRLFWEHLSGANKKE